LKSYAYGEWVEGAGEGRSVYNAVTGAEIASVDSVGLDFKRMLDHAREAGGPALRGLTFPRRGELIRGHEGRRLDGHRGRAGDPPGFFRFGAKTDARLHLPG